MLEICSSASFQPLPGFNIYAATKAFLLRYSRALRWEAAPRGIRVTAVCPGVDPHRVHGRGPGTPKNGRHGALLSPLPSGRRPWPRRALRDSRWMAVTTCGLPALVQRAASKFLPHCFIMACWEGLRRL